MDPKIQCTCGGATRKTHTPDCPLNEERVPGFITAAKDMPASYTNGADWGFSGPVVISMACPPGCEKEWFLKGFQEAMRVISDQVKKVSPPSILIDKEVYKPLRWRTGPVPETDKWDEFLVCSPLSATGYGYSIRKGNLIGAGEKYIPLSDILGLVENPKGDEG